MAGQHQINLFTIVLSTQGSNELLSRTEQGNWPFVELGFGQDSLLRQLEEELAQVVPCDLTVLQSRLHPHAYEDVWMRAQSKFHHTLDSLLQQNKDACSRLILKFFPLRRFILWNWNEKNLLSVDWISSPWNL